MWLTPIVLLLAVGGIYYGVSDNARLPDDTLAVWDNDAVTGSDFGGVLLGRFYSVTSEWRHAVRPVSTLVQHVESSAFQQDRSAFQWSLLLFHVLAAALLSSLVAKTSRSKIAGALGGLLFAVHPALTASVLRLSGLSEVLALCFVCLAMLLTVPLVVSPQGSGARRGTRLVLISSFVLAAVWSKEVAFVAIPIVAIWALSGAAAGSRTFRRPWQEPALLALGLAAVGVIVLAHRWIAITALPDAARLAVAIGPDTGEPLARRFLLGIASVPTYLRLVFFPTDLGYSYDFAHAWSGSALAARAAVGFAVLGAMTALVIRSARQRDQELALWSTFTLLGLFAATGIAAPIGDYVSERSVYFILPGVIGLVLCFVRRFSPRSTLINPVGTVVCVVIAGLLGFRTMQREADFRDPETLIRAQQRTYPNSAQAEYDLGNLFLSRGLFPAAQSQYEKAVNRRDGFWMAWVNRGAAYSGMEEYGLARRAYEYAIRGMEGEKDFAAAQARAYYNRALVLMRQNANTEATADLKKTIEVFPDHLRAHANLGLIYRNNPAYDDDALYHLGVALELEKNPENRASLEAAVAEIKERRAELDLRLQRRIEAGLADDPSDSLDEN